MSDPKKISRCLCQKHDVVFTATCLRLRLIAIESWTLKTSTILGKFFA